MSQYGNISASSGSQANRLVIETDLTTYTLTANEIKEDPIVFFTSTTERNVNLNFPASFDGGHTVEAYQSFSQGLGDIIVDAPFQSPALDTFQKPGYIKHVTTPGSKVNILGVEDTICAFATVDPSLFLDDAAAEIASYEFRYRLHIYNGGVNYLEFGLDNIPIEAGWSGASRYKLVIDELQYVPKNADAYHFQFFTWSSTGGSAPEGGYIFGNFTTVSDNSKTVDITDNTNGTCTFAIYKKPKLTLF